MGRLAAAALAWLALAHPALAKDDFLAPDQAYRYTIDAEGYRARRADQLKNLALMMLERTIREKKPQRLEPMLPSERKIVHLALAENTYVRTESEGAEPERRVVIHPK